MKLSQYQIDALEFIRSGVGHGAVSAVAGSGKSTLLELIAKEWHGSGVIAAFNKEIALAMEKRLKAAGVENVTATTCHSVGMRAVSSVVGKVKVDAKSELLNAVIAEAANRIAHRMFALQVGKPIPEDILQRFEEMRTDVDRGLKNAVHFAKVGLIPYGDNNALREMVSFFGVEYFYAECEDELWAILKASEKMAREGVITFDDMIWLPCIWDLRLPTYDLVLVDEAQDLSPALLWIVKRMIGLGGRFIAVGDPHQTIQVFAGADLDSWSKVSAGATQLPLSVCYRCPISHIKLAQKYVPHIEPAENAVEGVVEYIPNRSIPDRIKDGDLVIARTNAELVPLALRGIALGKPCRVKGRNIGLNLTAIIRRIAKRRNFAYIRFMEFLDEWQEMEMAKAGKNDAWRQRIEDQYACIAACYADMPVNSAKELCRHIENIFTDDRASVRFATIHSAKGGQAHTVYVVSADQLGSVRAGSKSWEAQVERNLAYVALTRSEYALYLGRN